MISQLLMKQGGKLSTNYFWTEWWSKACPSSLFINSLSTIEQLQLRQPSTSKEGKKSTKAPNPVVCVGLILILHITEMKYKFHLNLSVHQASDHLFIPIKTTTKMAKQY